MSRKRVMPPRLTVRYSLRPLPLTRVDLLPSQHFTTLVDAHHDVEGDSNVIVVTVVVLFLIFTITISTSLTLLRSQKRRVQFSLLSLALGISNELFLV